MQATEGSENRQRFGLLTRHRKGARPVPAERARSRTSAYVYGNILVLAAVVGADDAQIADTAAVLAVLVTTVTTYLAHVLAHDIGQRIFRSEDEHEEHVREELVDAVPIISSGLVPLLVLAAGAFDWLPVRAAQVIASAVVVLRLAGTGLTVERLSNRRASGAAFWSGVALALAGAAVAGLKVAFAH